MTAEIIERRKQVCEMFNCTAAHEFDNPLAVCPNGHWTSIDGGTRAEIVTGELKQQPLQVGDMLEMFAQPIARVLDAVFGTNIQNCGGCKTMKKDLNEGMSVKEALKKRFTKGKPNADTKVGQ